MAAERDLGGSCLKALGCGCVALLLVGVLGGVGSCWWVGNLAESADRARDVRQDLDERFGALGAWRPAEGWRLDPERLDAFLRVRAGLAEPCADVAEFFGRVEELERTASGGETPKAREALGILGPALRLPGRMTRYVEERNRLLAEVGMGLGEYAFLTVLADRSGTAGPPAAPAAPLEDAEPGDATPEAGHPVVGDDEVQAAFLQGLEALADGAAARDPELATALRAERERLGSEGWAAVFPDGPPAAWALALESRAAEIVGTRCPVADEIALAVTRREGAPIRFE